MKPLDSWLRNEDGQFIPITAMAMLTIVVMTAAAVNVYTVTHAKLKLQNIAEAAALNLAAKEAKGTNVVVDRDEWLNHFMAGAPTIAPDDSVRKQLGDNMAVANCADYFKKVPRANGKFPVVIPPISCVENKAPEDNTAAAEQRFVFNSEFGVKGYAQVVKTINDAQRQFIQAYNSFLGAPAAGAASAASSVLGPTDFIGDLLQDIPDPELQNGSIQLAAWNSRYGESTVKQRMQQLEQDPSPSAGGGGPAITSQMEPLQFKIHHNIQVRYHQMLHVDSPFGGGSDIPHYYVKKADLGTEAGAGPEGAGWMVPDEDKMPKIQVSNAASGQVKTRVGVGVSVLQVLNIPGLGKFPVTANAKAFLVDKSGAAGEDCTGDPCEPKEGFQPTSWVKLAPPE